MKIEILELDSDGLLEGYKQLLLKHDVTPGRVFILWCSEHRHGMIFCDTPLTAELGVATIVVAVDSLEPVYDFAAFFGITPTVVESPCPEAEDEKGVN